MTTWRTIFSLGDDGGLARRPLTGGLTSRPVVEQLHRAVVDPEPNFDLGYTAPFARPVPETEPAEAEPEETEPGETAPEETEPAETNAAVELPPVVVPPERDMGAAVRALLAPVAQRLRQLEVDGNLSVRRDGLLVELEAFVELLAALLTEERAARIARLTAEHELAAQRCRDQLAAVDLAKQEKGWKEAVVRRCQQQASTARTLVDGCDATQPNLNNWPKREQVERWRKEHERLTGELEKAEIALAEGLQALHAAQRRLGEEQTKLWKLAEAERMLRNRLSGNTWTDSETGLVGPPEL